MLRHLPPILGLVVTAIAIGVVAPAVAQEPLTVGLTQVDTSAYPDVQLTVTVFDASGQPVGGLGREAFSVLQGGQPVEGLSVEEALNSELGIGVVIVLDVSGSMRDALAAAQEAARGFVAGLKEGDEVAVVSFSDQVTVVEPFTGEKDAALAAIDGLAVQSYTALYDAVLQAAELAASSPLPRQAVVLLSDGANDDRDGGASREESLAGAAEAGVPIFVVGLGAKVDEAYIGELAAATGGRAFVAPDAEALAGLYDTVAELLRRQYVLRYTGPPALVPEQTLEVRVTVGSATASVTHQFSVEVDPSLLAPQVTLPGLEPNQEVAGDLRLEPEIDAANAVVSVTYRLDGEVLLASEQPPYELLLEPVTMSPGNHTLTVEVEDTARNVGSVAVPFVAALVPPEITIERPAEGEEVTGAFTVKVDLRSQTPVSRVTVLVDGREVAARTAEPFAFRLEALPEGGHQLTIRLTTVDGRSAEQTRPVTAAAGGGGVGLPLPALGLAVLAVLAVALFTWQWRRWREEGFLRGPRGRGPSGPGPAAAEPLPKELPLTAPAVRVRARLRAVDGPLAGQTYQVGDDPVVVGIGADAAVQAGDVEGEARPLVRIWRREGKFMFHQVSPGPVALGGRQVAWAVLEPGDEITVAASRFVFEPDEDGSAGDEQESSDHHKGGDVTDPAAVR